MEILRDENLENWLIKPRMVGADYHFLLGRAWLKYGEPSKLQTPLVYAAFEFRCAIERVAFEVLILFKKRKLDEETLRCSRDFKNLLSLLSKLEGKQGVIYKKTRFIQIICELGNAPFSPALINLKELDKYWRACSKFCHKLLSPEETWEKPLFIQRGYKILNEIDSYFENILIKHKLVWNIELQPEVDDLQQEFINGNVTEKQVILRLKLMEPVLKQRTFLGNL